MKCPECQATRSGLMATQMKQRLQAAIRRRYRRIDSQDEVVELSGDEFDAIQDRLAEIVEESKA